MMAHSTWSSRRQLRFCRGVVLGLWFFWGLCSALPGRELKRDINVNVTLTEEGKKISPPSKASPAYYYPVVAGYHAEGRALAGEKQPPQDEVLRLLAKALAQQGYLVCQSGKTPLPTLLLVFHWGYVNPSIDVTFTDTSDPANSVPYSSFNNKREMLTLVSGTTNHPLESTDPINSDRALQDAREDRYCVLVSAFDFAAANSENKKKLLWQARMSTPSSRVTLEQVLPALVTTGAPHFGRETMPPKRVYVPVPPGQVEVGTPTVIPDAPKAEIEKSP